MAVSGILRTRCVRPPNFQFSLGKMNHARAGSCIHAPIYIDSSDSSDSSLVVLDEHSALTGLTAESAVHGVANQEAQEYVEDVVNSYGNATMTFKTTADNGDNGETVPVQTIQVPIAGDLTSNDELALRASQLLSIGGHGCANNMLNEAPDFQVQSHGVCLPEHAGTGGVRHSLGKRNQVNYNEGPARSAKKLPRNAREKPCRGGQVKKKFTSLRIRASFYP